MDFNGVLDDSMCEMISAGRQKMMKMDWNFSISLVYGEILYLSWLVCIIKERQHLSTTDLTPTHGFDLIRALSLVSDSM